MDTLGTQPFVVERLSSFGVIIVWSVHIIQRYFRLSFVERFILFRSVLYQRVSLLWYSIPANFSFLHKMTGQDIFNHLVLVEKPAKRNALFNFEEDHLFGLR